MTLEDVAEIRYEALASVCCRRSQTMWIDPTSEVGLIATELAEHGATVVINYHASVGPAEEAAAEIREQGGEAMIAQADVSDEAEVAAMHEEIDDAYDSADVLINNAGINADTLFSEMTRAEWDRVIEVDLTGAFVCTKEFFEGIQETPEGRLINISSVIGKQGNVG